MATISGKKSKSKLTKTGLTMETKKNIDTQQIVIEIPQFKKRYVCIICLIFKHLKKKIYIKSCEENYERKLGLFCLLNDCKT